MYQLVILDHETRLSYSPSQWSLFSLTQKEGGKWLLVSKENIDRGDIDGKIHWGKKAGTKKKIL